MRYALILKDLKVKVKNKRKRTDQSWGITHNSDFLVFDSYVVSYRVKICFIREFQESKSKEIYAKRQFMNGSNFVKLSKRRTKNVSRGSFLFAVSLF